MKRRALTLVVFLLLGAIVNVAVAWGCAWLLAEKSHGWSSTRSAATKFENGNVWGAFRVDRPGYFQVRSHVGGPIANWDDRWEHPQDIIEPWSHTPRAESDLFQWIEEGSGWPTICLWSRTSMHDQLRSFVEKRVLPRDFVEQGVVLPNFVAPIGTIWPGFAINTIFYAAMLWTAFVVPGMLRRRMRVRRGLCPACAYPIGSSPVCTECGEAVSKANE